MMAIVDVTRWRYGQCFMRVLDSCLSRTDQLSRHVNPEVHGLITPRHAHYSSFSKRRPTGVKDPSQSLFALLLTAAKDTPGANEHLFVLRAERDVSLGVWTVEMSL